MADVTLIFPLSSMKNDRTHYQRLRPYWRRKSDQLVTVPGHAEDQQALEQARRFEDAGDGFAGGRRRLAVFAFGLFHFRRGLLVLGNLQQVRRQDDAVDAGAVLEHGPRLGVLFAEDEPARRFRQQTAPHHKTTVKQKKPFYISSPITENED